MHPEGKVLTPAQHQLLMCKTCLQLQLGLIKNFQAWIYIIYVLSTAYKFHILYLDPCARLNSNLVKLSQNITLVQVIKSSLLAAYLIMGEAKATHDVCLALSNLWNVSLLPFLFHQDLYIKWLQKLVFPDRFE